MRSIGYVTVIGLGFLFGGAALAHKATEATAGPDAFLHDVMERGAKKSQAMQMTGDLDYDFVAAMKEHHQQAIEMANVVLQHGKDENAREFARKTLDMQKNDIAEFDQWLSKHSPKAGAGHDAMPGMQH